MHRLSRKNTRSALPVARRLAHAYRRMEERAKHLIGDDRGAATAEYAVATMAAVGFAGLLVVILRSDEVRGFLTDLVKKALSVE